MDEKQQKNQEYLNYFFGNSLKTSKIWGSLSKTDVKLVFLAYRDIAKKWEKTISNWGEIISQFSIIFEDRLNRYIR